MTTTRRRLAAAGLAILLLSVVIAWRYRALARANLIVILDWPLVRQAPTRNNPVEAKLVAHAGGAVRGLAYTNSREALEEHYAEGYRVFELDFHWTSDGRLVLVHDWAEISAQFGTKPHVFSFDEFVLARRRDGLHQLTFEDLQEWLQTHRDACVVTDTKDSNIRLLHYLQANGGDIRPQLIIQIYRMSELQPAQELAPRAVWLTVYKYAYPAWALTRISGVDAFVIPIADYYRYREPLVKGRMHIYVHSVRSQSVDETFRRLPGIYGVYVD